MPTSARGGHVYVDKTAILKPLADGSLGSQFFIARPRRFGKSLAISTLQCLFEGRREKYYQSLFYAVFTLVGARTYAECWTNRGRVDAVVETPCGVYVFEFKLNDTAASALAQIKAKGYHEKWLRRGKKVTLVGAAFDADLRNLSDRQIEVAAK